MQNGLSSWNTKYFSLSGSSSFSKVNCAVLLSISTFSQKKELKSVEKALKANDFTTAKENLSNISSTYDLESLDKKIKIKYHYLRGMHFLKMV